MCAVSSEAGWGRWQPNSDLPRNSPPKRITQFIHKKWILTVEILLRRDKILILNLKLFERLCLRNNRPTWAYSERAPQKKIFGIVFHMVVSPISTPYKGQFFSCFFFQWYVYAFSQTWTFWSVLLTRTYCKTKIWSNIWYTCVPVVIVW